LYKIIWTENNLDYLHSSRKWSESTDNSNFM